MIRDKFIIGFHLTLFNLFKREVFVFSRRILRVGLWLGGWVGGSGCGRVSEDGGDGGGYFWC